MRALWLLGVAAGLAACTAPDGPARPEPPAPPGTASPAPADVAGRGAAAGLSRAQTDVLAGLGVPVALPGARPDGWRVTSVYAQRVEGYPEYRIVYAGPDGACAAVVGATEGLGDRLVLAPPAEREIDVPGLATYGPARLGWSDRAVAADEGWGERRAATEWFGADAVAYAVDSPADGACARADPDDLTALVASLRPLDPRDDLGPGVWAWTDAGAETAPGAASAPEAAARAAAGVLAGPDPEGSRPTVEMGHAHEGHAVALVTRTGQADDSVRDVRWRLAIGRDADGWRVRSVGQQTRCQPGRGHPAWSAEPCR